MALTAILLFVSAGGCIDVGITRPENPSFSMTAKHAKAALKDMARSPHAPDRPLVILAGFGDPGLGPWLLEGRLRDVLQTRDPATHRRRVIGVSYAFNTSFEGCRRKVVDAVERAFPSDDAGYTTEVDVIGISLGGVVARYAADPPEEAIERSTGRSAKRLRIARLFTISSPHRGAVQADSIVPLSSLHADLRTKSDFMARLNDPALPTPAYAVYPYVRLGDKTVGAENASPAGRPPYWLPNLPFEIAHGQAWSDPRILADIARRLRGEPPLASEPPAPLPDGRATRPPWRPRRRRVPVTEVTQAAPVPPPRAFETLRTCLHSPRTF